MCHSARSQVTVNDDIPAFTISEDPRPTELYSQLLTSLPDIDIRMLRKATGEIETLGLHPLAGDDTSGFLRRLVQSLSPRGSFEPDVDSVSSTDDPIIYRAPVIFLRRRTLGFASALQSVVEHLKIDEEIPSSLLNVVGVESDPVEPEDDVASMELWGDAEDILLSKPANSEQMAVADRLQRHDGVLVQGPPGTGKTHTIGNLIGHLLAQGKSVLVTSEKTKALRVLREQVVEPLRPLCVSTLASDQESQQELEISVKRIAERLSSSDPEQLDRDAGRLANERSQLLASLRTARESLLEARSGEYREIVIAGDRYTPSDAARKVAREAGRHDWVPGPVTSGAPLPLTEGQFVELYSSNARLSTEDEGELSRKLPKPAQLLTADEFDALVAERRQLTESESDLGADLWDEEGGLSGADELSLLGERLVAAVAGLSGDGWRIDATTAGWRGGGSVNPWKSLIGDIERARAESEGAQESLLEHGPSLADDIALDEQIETLTAIVGSLDPSGSLGSIALMLHPSWKRIISYSAVGNARPRLREEF